MRRISASKFKEQCLSLLDDLQEDLAPGEELLALFRPFIEHLASSGLSPKTIRRHVDNVWRYTRRDKEVQNGCSEQSHGTC